MIVGLCVCVCVHVGGSMIVGLCVCGCVCAFVVNIVLDITLLTMVQYSGSVLSTLT